MSDQATPKPGPIDHIAAKFTYITTIFGVYFLFGTLFFYSGKGKLFDDAGMPDALAKQFSGTFFDTFPGVDAAWTIIGLMEFVVFLITLASLLTLEFLPSKRKPILFAALGLALLTFSFLAIGENVTGQNEGVASLFLYAAGTAIFMILLRYLPPYRSFSDD
jgi:hypothetical protein